MRQFFTWRVWFALAALGAVALLLRAVLPADASKPPVPTSSPTDHRIDFIAHVYAVQPSPSFKIDNGIVTGSVDMVIDGQRTMHVVEGTLGEIACKDYTKLGKCVVLADLLGDAVIWFALENAAPELKLDTVPIDKVIDDTTLRLTNGWIVHYAPTIDRRCAQETSSLSEFLRKYGPASTTIIDVTTQQVVAVQCDKSVTAA